MIEIQGLFGRFDYKIKLKDDGVSILTGPNGYGKSTILKCIEAIQDEDFIFFLKLDFKEISFIFEKDENNINISKDEQILKLNNLRLNSYDFNEKEINYFSKDEYFLLNDKAEQQLEPLYYNNKRNFVYFTREGHLKRKKVSDKLIDKLKDYKETIGPIYYIKEQRLIREHINAKSKQGIVNVINELPKKFQNKIRDISNNYSNTANKLDGSYPYRLFNTEVGISEKEYTDKIEEMSNKFEKLTKYDISEMQNSGNVIFKEEHAKALKIYFEDFNEKYTVYEDFIAQLDLFTDIVNNRLSFKKIKISREDGIIVNDLEDKNSVLKLDQLSSGEQQEIVLFYELIFETTNDVLLLIDEPEISLHITWQKMFMDDLLKVVNFKGFKVIVATHSPQIINNHWDRQIDLGELYSEQLHQR